MSWNVEHSEHFFRFHKFWNITRWYLCKSVVQKNFRDFKSSLGLKIWAWKNVHCGVWGAETSYAIKSGISQDFSWGPPAIFVCMHFACSIVRQQQTSRTWKAIGSPTSSLFIGKMQKPFLQKWKFLTFPHPGAQFWNKMESMQKPIKFIAIQITPQWSCKRRATEKYFRFSISAWGNWLESLWHCGLCPSRPCGKAISNLSSLFIAGLFQIENYSIFRSITLRKYGI